MTERLDTPLAELLLARGLVGRPLLSEALAHVRGQRGQDEQVSLALFLLQRQVVAPELLQRVLEEAGRSPSLQDTGARPSSAPKGEQLGAYRLLRKIAEGGMGAVYEVAHVETGARYALKVIKAEAGEFLDDAALGRLRREARLSAALDHPGVVRVHAAEFEGPVPYLVQDLLTGGTLTERVHGSGVFAPEVAAELGARLAEGLAAAHEAGILHRDLKPDNVLFNEGGDPVLVDFGLSRRVSGNSIQLTQSGEILGTPAYMAPEQALDVSSVREAADVYALGAILYFALEGVSPFSGQTVLETLHLVLSEPAPESVSAPPALRALIARVMNKEPSERPSAAELAGLLRQSVAEPEPPSKLGPLAIAALVALVALAAALIWAQQRGESPPLTPGASATPTPRVTSPGPQVAAFARVVREGRREIARKLAAVELLRRAPQHPTATEARTLARSLERRRLGQIPALPGRAARDLGFLPEGRSLFAVNATSVGRFDLAGSSAAWKVSGGPPGVLLSGSAVGEGKLWISTSQRSGWVFSLPVADLGVAGLQPAVLSPAKAWEPKLLDSTAKAGVASLAWSPAKRLLARGRGSRITLYRVEDRQPLDLMILPLDLQRPRDAELGRVLTGVSHLEFVSEDLLLVVMNKRLRDSLVSGDVPTYPAGGLVALLSVKEGKLRLRGGFAVHQAATAVALTSERLYVGDNLGNFLSYEWSSFPTDPLLRLSASKSRAAGQVVAAVKAPKLARVCGIAHCPDGTLLTSHREAQDETKGQLGRWTPGAEGSWTYEPFGQTPLPSGLILSQDGDLLLVPYHRESRERKPGEVWFVGPIPGR